MRRQCYFPGFFCSPQLHQPSPQSWQCDQLDARSTCPEREIARERNCRQAKGGQVLAGLPPTGDCFPSTRCGKRWYYMIWYEVLFPDWLSKPPTIRGFIWTSSPLRVNVAQTIKFAWSIYSQTFAQDSDEAMGRWSDTLILKCTCYVTLQKLLFHIKWFWNTPLFLNISMKLTILLVCASSYQTGAKSHY